MSKKPVLRNIFLSKSIIILIFTIRLCYFMVNIFCHKYSSLTVNMWKWKKQCLLRLTPDRQAHSFSSFFIADVATWSQKDHKLFSATYILCSKRRQKIDRRFPILTNVGFSTIKPGATPRTSDPTNSALTDCQTGTSWNGTVHESELGSISSTCLRAAFTPTDPKSAKRQRWLDCFFALLRKDFA